LYDGSSSIGKIGSNSSGGSAGASSLSISGRARITPSNASHTYSVRASVDSGTGLIVAGAGVVTANFPTYMRITKV
jgi:hypothetical protein